MVMECDLFLMRSAKTPFLNKVAPAQARGGVSGLQHTVLRDTVKVTDNHCSVIVT